MKKTIRMLSGLLALSLLIAGMAMSADITSAGVKGAWTQGATWVGGVAPKSTDNVIISNRDTVTIDASITIANITVGKGDTCLLTFNTTTPVAVTVTGDITIADKGCFRVVNNTIAGGGNLVHSMSVAGNITCNTATGWDMKRGSGGSTLTVCNVTFSGATNSTITLTGTTQLYVADYEFSGMTISKSGTGRVILKSDVYVSSGSSTVTNPGGNPVITFVRGVIETGPYALVHAWTDGAGTVGASDSSYVLGTFGRGISNGSTGTRDFPIGDAKGYRPARIHNTTPGTATGHNIRVGVVAGNANNGSSTFADGIDKVSGVRYYKVMYSKGLTTNPASMTFDRFGGSYGLNDGVAAGNTNLRLAISDSTRALWTNYGPTGVATALDSLPRMVYSESGKPTVTLNDGQWMTVALARVTGTTENSLLGTGTSVKPIDGLLPTQFSVGQNYPNPFNPSTVIEYGVPKETNVSVKIFNAIGQEVATLLDQRQAAGTYRVVFDARNFPTGLYMYQVRAGEQMQAKKMMLVK